MNCWKRGATRQSVVRIFRMTQQTTGNDVEWRKLWWKVATERWEQTSNPLVKEVDFDQDDAQTKRLSMPRGAQHGTRDLDLEQALTLRLESHRPRCGPCARRGCG
ncbi:hypothetical protein [Corallococcus sp. AS-1-12]|uniref:hypothetical protein n=1 Tax=Corallococcus sp. AS-1-12 TaxID=2874598 RepID=UPI001CBF121A|nr:hypothetical protein [Corallococcus sp. AS-1-12]MBZ4336015.1 hypothetical protein [Corallococcus sp. AS-1-12]